MIQELLYTSAPRGLKPGSRGFCTVLCTSGMAAPTATSLEGLSGYRPLPPPAGQSESWNPIVWSHLVLPLGGRRSSILSRISSYGLDYSQRNNKLAHHVVLDSEDRPVAGPAWLIGQAGFMRAKFEGEPRIVPNPAPRVSPPAGPAKCELWEQVCGDGGWAGRLAEEFLRHPDRPAFVVFGPGMDVLGLVREAIALLPEERRWDVTFSTYFTKLPTGATCVWRCVAAESPEAQESRRHVHSLRIDLTSKLPRAEGGDLVDLARTGRRRAATMPLGQEPSGRPSPGAADGGRPIRVVNEPRRPPRRRAEEDWMVRAEQRASNRRGPSLLPYLIAAAAMACVVIAVAVVVLRKPHSQPKEQPVAQQEAGSNPATTVPVEDVKPAPPPEPRKLGNLKLGNLLKAGINEHVVGSSPNLPQELGRLTVETINSPDKITPRFSLRDTERHEWFQIKENGADVQLLLTKAVNFETTRELKVRVLAEADGFESTEATFTIDIVDQNDPPEALVFNALPYEGNQPLGAVVDVGEFSATDQDGDTLQWSLVEGEGDADNHLFTLANDPSNDQHKNKGILRTSPEFDFLRESRSYSIRVVVADGKGGKVAQSFEKNDLTPSYKRLPKYSYWELAKAEQSEGNYDVHVAKFLRFSPDVDVDLKIWVPVDSAEATKSAGNQVSRTGLEETLVTVKWNRIKVSRNRPLELELLKNIPAASISPLVLQINPKSGMGQQLPSYVFLHAQPQISSRTTSQSIAGFSFDIPMHLSAPLKQMQFTCDRLSWKIGDTLISATGNPPVVEKTENDLKFSEPSSTASVDLLYQPILDQFKSITREHLQQRKVLFTVSITRSKDQSSREITVIRAALDYAEVEKRLNDAIAHSVNVCDDDMKVLPADVESQPFNKMSVFDERFLEIAKIDLEIISAEQRLLQNEIIELQKRQPGPRAYRKEVDPNGIKTLSESCGKCIESLTELIAYQQQASTLAQNLKNATISELRLSMRAKQSGEPSDSIPFFIYPYDGPAAVPDAAAN